MPLARSFAGAFGGCLGVGCAVVVVVVGLPLGCLMVSGCAPSADREASEVAKQQLKSRIPSSASTGSPLVSKTAPKPPQRSEHDSRPKGHESHPTDLVVSDAAAVYAAFDRNEVKADNDMKDKWFAVKGRIQKIGKDILNTPYVALGNGQEFSVFCVQCMFTDADQSVLAQLRPGETVAIAGKCSGKMGNVIMRECWLYDEGAWHWRLASGDRQPRSRSAISLASSASPNSIGAARNASWRWTPYLRGPGGML
jgi:tRNA_anti-like